jgi:hypothetical protein
MMVILLQDVGRPWTAFERGVSIQTVALIMISGLLTSYSFYKQLERTKLLDIPRECVLRLTRYSTQFCVKYVSRLMRYSTQFCVKYVSRLMRYSTQFCVKYVSRLIRYSTQFCCCIVDGYCCCVIDRHCFLPAILRYVLYVSHKIISSC